MPIYLGRPDTFGMLRLPYPNAGYTAPVDRNVQQQKTADGGVATARRLKPRRTWNLQFGKVTSDVAVDLVLSFYTGAVGPGPYALIDTNWQNFLPLDASLLGRRSGVVKQWTTSPAGAALTYDPATAAPALLGGVAQWTGVGASNVLSDGVPVAAGAYGPNLLLGVPYIAEQPYCASIYAKGSGTLQARCAGRTAAGATTTTVTGASVALSTTAWTRVSAVAAAGALGAGTQYVVAGFQAGTAANYTVACPQLEFAAAPSPWVSGLGVARVLSIETVENTVGNVAWHDLSLSLAEV